MKILNSFFLCVGLVLASYVPAGAPKEPENPFEYLAADATGDVGASLFNVNVDEMGPALFMTANGFFWTVRDVQNALKKLEVLGEQRQINKIITDVIKFMQSGPERHTEESLLKNSLATAFRGLGQNGHDFKDFPGWHVCVQGIAPALTNPDQIAGLKAVVDPWTIAPKSKKIILSKDLSDEAQAAAILARKNFQTIPFPFLYRIASASVDTAAWIKKIVWYGGLLWGGSKVFGVGNARVNDYVKEVQSPEVQDHLVADAQDALHLSGPAVALYSFEKAPKNKKITVIKKPGNVPCDGVAGSFWTFDQIAAYRKFLAKNPEKLNEVHDALFVDIGAVSPFKKLQRMGVVLRLLVPSSDYDPLSLVAKMHAVWDKKRKYQHVGAMGRELVWLYRWAWFFAGRKTESDECPKDLLWVDLQDEDIPKKTFQAVQSLVQNSLSDCGFEPHAFASVCNASARAGKSVVFYDERKKAAQKINEYFNLYERLAGDPARLLINPFHTMPFWSVLYSVSADRGGCAPFAFEHDKDVSTVVDAECADGVAQAVLVARLKQYYPYAYFGFRAFKADSDDAAAGGDADPVPGVRRPAVPRRRPKKARTVRTAADYAYRGQEQHKVCEVVAFKTTDRTRFGGSSGVLEVRPNDAKIYCAGDHRGRIVFDDTCMVWDEELFMFAPHRCSEDTEKPHDKCEKNPNYMRKDSEWITEKYMNQQHPTERFSYLRESDLESRWINLNDVATVSGCVIEIVTKYEEGKWINISQADYQKARARGEHCCEEDEYVTGPDGHWVWDDDLFKYKKKTVWKLYKQRTYTCAIFCKTLADTQKVRAALASLGFAVATA